MKPGDLYKLKVDKQFYCYQSCDNWWDVIEPEREIKLFKKNDIIFVIKQDLTNTYFWALCNMKYMLVFQGATNIYGVREFQSINLE